MFSNKKYLRNILFFILAAALVVVLTAPGALAVPACPDVIDVQQPDGGSFSARIRGDEFQGWVETEDGYTVVKDKKSKRWEYALPDLSGTPKSSGIPARRGIKPPGWIKKGVRPKRNTEAEKRFFDTVLKKDRGTIQPGQPQSSTSGGAVLQGVSGPQLAGTDNWTPSLVSGDRNLLIILVNFADRSLVTTADDWYNSIFSTTGGAKSVKQFYLDNSFGQLIVNPVSHTQAGNPPGIVTVTLDTNHPNYGNNFDYGIETAWIGAALAQAANYVDFPSFDTDSDGYLFRQELVIYFIPAGYEASGTAKTPSIWAHAWGGAVNAGGVYITRWAMNGELNNYDAQHPMGVIAHEMGHSMCGLPDLYDITYHNMGIDAFSLMGSGSWGMASTDTYSGTTPVSLDAWSRRFLEWSTPQEPVTNGPLTFVPPLSATDAPVRLINPDLSNTEYFLVENRYPVSWDLGLERWLGADWGGGLLVLHVDSTIGTGGNNDINAYTSGSHQGVVVEEANASQGTLTGSNLSHARLIHLFYSGNNDAFAGDTTPDSRLYDGTYTGLGIRNISARSDSMTADFEYLPTSVIDSPVDGGSISASSYTITGTAVDHSGAGLDKVEVSTDGGTTWAVASGTASWSINWNIPRPDNYIIISRAYDLDGNVEYHGYDIQVTVNQYANPELPHYEWDSSYSNTGCALCHDTDQVFLPAGFRESPSFCATCHNAAAPAHERALYGGQGHPVLVNATSAGAMLPTYGDITSAEYSNRMSDNLPGGDVSCVTCHNPMRKTEDFGRTWEMTSTSDQLTYTLQYGGWAALGRLVPVVYRDTSLWSGPSEVKDRKDYLVPPSEYVYDESAGTITFAQAQNPSDYIYVTLDYPYLRVGTKDNRLCSDCHTQATHMGVNCLTCHTAHDTNNLAGIRATLRTTDRTELPVVFMSYTGADSFADGDGTYDGICEVCHTTTLYHTRDGSGSSHYDGQDCTTCHSHAGGFPR
jgi:M6 family metalloprotease-like protein